MIKKRFGLIKNFSIQARLNLAGALALVGLVATGSAGYIGLTQSNVGLEHSINSTTAVLNQMNADMMHDALRADVLLAILTGPDGPNNEKLVIRTDVQEHVSAFRSSLNNLSGLSLSDEIKAKVADMKPIVDTYLLSATKISSLALKDATAAKAEFPAFMGVFSTLEDKMGALAENIDRIGNSVGQEARTENQDLITIIMVAAIASTLVMVVTNLLVVRSITKPLTRVKIAIKEVALGNLGGRHSNFDRVSDLNDEVSEIAIYLEQLRIRLREAIEMETEITKTQAEQQTVVNALSVGLEHLSNGNLTEEINQSFPDQYEALRSNYNRTVERLNDTIGQIVKTSRGIRAQADDITQASSDLAQRTENQAATLEETAAALDQLTSSVKSAANGAREVETIVRSARQEAEDNGKVVLGAVEAMNGIERSSEQISRIIGVIDDIAFQTNLLALNAGVEAARAGDSGRGFAVVASEVRALAQRSSDASKEIKDLISTSTQLVSRGVDAVGSAGKALTSLVDRVTHISTLVSGIATGATQQSVALAEVNIGVTQLDQVAQRNAAMVDQSMAATQTLQQQAFGMDNLVSHFTIQPNRTAPAEAAQPRLRAVANR